MNIRDNGIYDFSPKTGRQIRGYGSINYKFLINDMFEKFKFYFG